MNHIWQFKFNSMKDHSKIGQFIERMVSGTPASRLEIDLKGLDINEVGLHGRTPLMVAAAEGLLAVIEMLVRNGASVNVIGAQKGTALHEAASNDNASVAKYLLSIGADIEAKADAGITPLMCAAAFGSINVLKVLIENHADPLTIAQNGFTAVDFAREKQEDAAADFLDQFMLHMK